MELNFLSFQLTVFTKIDRNAARDFVVTFGDEYFKTALPMLPMQDQPLFRVAKKQDQSAVMEISSNRFDYYFNLSDINAYKKVWYQQFCSIFSKLTLSNSITRAAVNFSAFAPNPNNELLNKLNKQFNFYTIFGDTDEISVRLNNRHKVEELLINSIVDIRSGQVENKMTFENQDCIVVHFDINNAPVDNIDKQDIKRVFEVLDEELGRKIDVYRNI